MKNYNNRIEIKVNMKHFIAILMIISIVLLVFYSRKIHTGIINGKLSNQYEKFVENNEEPTFKVSKIILYSSAGAIDNSIGETLQDLDISQFTDISIEIENKKDNDELTKENTVKELYIDKINIQGNFEKGERIFNYKNPYLSGKFKMLKNCQDGRIDYRVVNTNLENDEANYDDAIFYTDCSNPITLGYINKNIVERYCVSEKENSVSFDGRLLKNANEYLNTLNCRISFQIHIINNEGRDFICPIVLDNDVDNGKNEIYDGYVIKALNVDNEGYAFIQMN